MYLFEKDESDDTLKRDGGTTQVVFDGHSLYLYADDTKPGDAQGNAVGQFGAEWSGLHPTGEKTEEGGS